MIMPGFAYITFDSSFIDNELMLETVSSEELDAKDSVATEGVVVICCMDKALF